MTRLASRSAQLALEQVAAELRAGDVVTADRTLQGALLHNPNNPALLAELAELEARRGRTAEAKLLLRRAISVTRSASGLKVRLARLLQAGGEFAAALKEVRELPDEIRGTFDVATLECALLGRSESMIVRSHSMND